MIQQHPPPTSPAASLKTLYGISVTLICTGLLLVVLFVVGMIISMIMVQFIAALTGGIFLFFTGVLGIHAVKRARNHTHSAGLMIVLIILCALCCVGAIINGIMNLLYLIIYTMTLGNSDVLGVLLAVFIPQIIITTVLAVLTAIAAHIARMNIPRSPVQVVHMPVVQYVTVPNPNMQPGYAGQPPGYAGPPPGYAAPPPGYAPVPTNMHPYNPYFEKQPVG